VVDKCKNLRDAVAAYREINDGLKTKNVTDLNAVGGLDQNETDANCATLTAVSPMSCFGCCLL